MKAEVVIETLLEGRLNDEAEGAGKEERLTGIYWEIVNLLFSYP